MTITDKDGGVLTTQVVSASNTPPTPAEARAARLQQEIESIQAQLTMTAREFEKRRHRFFELRWHPAGRAVPLVAIGFALVGITGAGIAMTVKRFQRRARVSIGLTRLLQVIRR